MTTLLVLTFCQMAFSAATEAPATTTMTAKTQAQKTLLSSHQTPTHHYQRQQQVLFPEQSADREAGRMRDQPHRSPSLLRVRGSVERKSDHQDVSGGEVLSAHSSLTPVHATDFNELRGRYGYFPPSMFREFMDDARARTFNTLYGSIDAKGMFHPAVSAAHKQSPAAAGASLAGESIAYPGPDSQSQSLHHNNNNNPSHSSTAGSPAASSSLQGSHSDSPFSAGVRSKWRDGASYTPSYQSSEGESASTRERKYRQIQIGETLSSSPHDRDGGSTGGNKRSFGLLSHLMHHPPHAFMPPSPLMYGPMMPFMGHEMMMPPPFMPPYHSPYHSMLPLHQLEHMYPYSRPFMPFMGYEHGMGTMPPAYAGYGMGYPGLYHRSQGDGSDAAPSTSHASQIHLSGGMYPPLHHPGHHSPRHPHHLHPHHESYQFPGHPFSLMPSHSSPPRTRFPYSFRHPEPEIPRPVPSSSASSHKHDRHHEDWPDVDIPSRPRAASQVREAYDKMDNASKLPSSPFLPMMRRS